MLRLTVYKANGVYYSTRDFPKSAADALPIPIGKTILTVTEELPSMQAGDPVERLHSAAIKEARAKGIKAVVNLFDDSSGA